MLNAQTVQVTVRLNRGATARVWTADSCAAQPPEAQTITRSGVHAVTVEGPGSRVCLASDDGALTGYFTIRNSPIARQSIPVE